MGVIHGNFGDELGPYIISKLSSHKVEHVPIPRDGIFLLATYFKNLVLGRYPLKMFPAVLKSFFIPGRYLTSVGSIIGWSSGFRTVWGSGILYYNERINNGKFLAVRGQYTQRRLRNLGYEVPDVLGDPALLLPIIFNPKVEKKYKLGIIPHHTHTKSLASLGKEQDVLVIDLLDDVEVVIKKILTCESVISTSLHGLIVAHAYGIPALWYEYRQIAWHGSDVKFLDYFSSVDIPEYVPFQMPKAEDFVLETILHRFNSAKAHILIQVKLSVIQKKLLDVAPFSVNRCYDGIVNEYI